MSFREKSALVSIVALLAASIGYVVVLVANADGRALASLDYQPYMLGFVIVLALVSIVGQVAVALASPREAQAPADERERQIAWRSGILSGYVLAVAAFVAICLAMAEVPWFWIANAVLALWVLAEVGGRAYALTLSRRGV
jgi:hypothetical protein